MPSQCCTDCYSWIGHSPDILKDFGLKWVIIGHSERRQLYGESDQVWCSVGVCARMCVFVCVCVRACIPVLHMYGPMLCLLFAVCLCIDYMTLA